MQNYKRVSIIILFQNEAKVKVMGRTTRGSLLIAISLLLFQNKAGVKEEVKDYKRVYYLAFYTISFQNEAGVKEEVYMCGAIKSHVLFSYFRTRLVLKKK